MVKITKAGERKYVFVTFLWFYFFLPPLGGGGGGANSRMAIESLVAERFIAPVT